MDENPSQSPMNHIARNINNTNAPQVRAQQFMPLTNEQFITLQKSLGLLRISQLRSVVQKFGLPASGNKTKLLRIVIQLLGQIRNSPIISSVYAEVANLLGRPHLDQQADVNSAENPKLIAIPPPSPLPDTALIRYTGNYPLVVKLDQPGTVSGVFQFNLAKNGINLCIFAITVNDSTDFQFILEVNGYQITKHQNDTDPQPINITPYLCVGNNILNVLSLTSPVPLLLYIAEFVQSTPNSVLQQYFGTSEIKTVKGNLCSHDEGFSVTDFLASHLCGRPYLCPICSQPVTLESLVRCE